MSINLGFVESYMKEHAAELMWEAEQVRLADAATGPRQPLKMRVAEWLHSVAERIEGAPRQPAVRVHASY